MKQGINIYLTNGQVCFVKVTQEEYDILKQVSTSPYCPITLSCDNQKEIIINRSQIAYISSDWESYDIV